MHHKKYKDGFSLFVSFWTLLRIFAVITIWTWDPFLGSLFNIFIDAIDGHIFEYFGLKRDTYEIYDKWLDLWFYFALALFTYQNLQGSLFYLPLIWLFILRLTGILLFAKFNKEWLLFAFPNLFEPFFLVVVGFPHWLTPQGIPLVFWGIFVTKMLMEWWIHLAKLDLTSIILRKPTRWNRKRKKK
ncbi:MAG: hypothetical protein HN981_00855 [Candidatus Pacebacteria bacterium]|jgi:hypothetical protein|nr:hypothetical protein [Candidatus Paceibacterota bacterium]MBT6756597.1 hypothetical protein [Candidatus Paceibacterota bacterium]MBT6920928.1 hypothetical protein [Candidatus Paceibacterota bacterium]